MKTATIYFSDGSTLTLSEGDIIVPIVPMVMDNEKFASMDKSVKLYNHIHDGLIPSIMEALCHCPFFYIGSNCAPVYGTNSIVKIE